MFSRVIRAAPTLRFHIHTFPALAASKPNPTHDADTYSKDVDSTPPPDPKVHKVDPSVDNVQQPHRGPQPGVGMKEYQTMQGENEPYEVRGGKGERYGGRETYVKDKGPETSHPGDGPEGKESGGRKPEGR